VLVADLARSIVGDTSATQTTLWFQLHAAPAAGDRLVCVVRPAGAAERRVGLALDATRALTTVAIVAGLSAATVHAYELRLVKPDGHEYTLTRGRVRTLEANPQRLTMAFASCHLPDAPPSLNRWHALAARDDIDRAFMIGDQIYGDGIEKISRQLLAGALRAPLRAALELPAGARRDADAADVHGARRPRDR